MNITYWVLVSLLIAISFVMIIPPLWKKREILDTDPEQRNVNIARDRAQDLKKQLQAGALSQQQFDEQYEELELSLGDDLDNEAKTSRGGSQGRWIVPVLVVFVPMISLATYAMIGEPEALIKAQLQQSPQSATPTQADFNAMVNGLAERMKQEPDNAKGWVMLGRSYKYLKQYGPAVSAFEKAYALLGDEPELMLDYADALAMTNDGKLRGKASELIFKSIEKKPDSVSGLWLAALAKAETGELDQAMQYLRKLETILPQDSDSFAELKKLMAAISRENTTAQPVTEGTKSTAAAVSIDVNVSLDPVLSANVSPNDTVFVYAKALTGPPMPLAIIRKQVTDLPLSVTLDDTMAMIPTMKLSKFKQVKVMARVSKSGTAMQQKGDLIGFQALQELAGKTTLSVVINQVVK